MYFGTNTATNKPFSTITDFMLPSNIDSSLFTYSTAYDGRYSPYSWSSLTKKRLIFNSASKYNSCDYIIPGVIHNRW